MNGSCGTSTERGKSRSQVFRKPDRRLSGRSRSRKRDRHIAILGAVIEHFVAQGNHFTRHLVHGHQYIF